MVNVYTNNGQFNITESLMEAIKAINPNILMEKKQKKQTAGEKYEEEEVNKINKDLKNYSLDFILNQFPQNRLNNEDLKTLSTAFKKYFSLDDNKTNKAEKAHLKSLINKFLSEKEIRFNGSDAVTAIENAVNNEYEDNHKRLFQKNAEDVIDNFKSRYTNVADKANELDKKEREEIEQRNIERKFRKHHIDNAADQILFQQILKNGGDISKGIVIDGKKLSDSDIKKRIKRNPYFQQAWDEFEKNKDAQKEISVNSKEIEKAENEASILNKDYEPKTLEELLNAQRLIDEINVIESSAKKLVITAKESISSILGLFGNTQRNTSSNLKKNVPVNDNNQQVPLKKAANESLESDGYMLNEDNSYIPLTAVNDNTMDSYKSNKTGLGKNFGAFGALATGGFNLQPLFDGSVDDKKNFGICMKYYKEYTPSENKKSLVDNLMEYLILKHSNIDMFNDNIKEETIKLHPDLKNSKRKINEVIQKLSVDLDNISAKFLSNVVYKLEIGNDNTFNEILRAVRFAPKLKERYDIRNESKLQIFGIREQALIFQDSNIKSVVGIFISIPLLAKTTELAKQAMKLGRHFKNIKA